VEPWLRSDKKEGFASLVVKSKYKKRKTKNKKFLHSANKVKKTKMPEREKQAGIKKAHVYQ